MRTRHSSSTVGIVVLSGTLLCALISYATPSGRALASPRATAVGPGPYFGQPAPGLTPVVFAPELAADLRLTRTPVFTDGGLEAFWSTNVGKNQARLMTCRVGSGGWTRAEALPFSTGEYFDHNPAPSLDSARLVFASNRPIPGKSPTVLPGTTVPTSDLWLTERTATGWSTPTPLAPEINTDADEDLPALTRDGSLYFGSSRTAGASHAGIYRSRFLNGRFGAPERVAEPVASADGEMLNYVAPDESLLIFLSFRSGAEGGLRVSFRQPDGRWGEPVRLGESIASLRAYFLWMSADGERLFFTSAPKGETPRVYWVDGKVVRDLQVHGGRGGRVPFEPRFPR